jgi:predicted O-methyltransferase YrrM
MFMSRTLVACLAAAGTLVGALPAESQSPAPPTGVPASVYTVMQAIKRADTGQLAVSEEDGRFLRVLAASTRARHALEIGGASGYSALWIGLGLRESGGKLVSIEYDAQRAREAKANIERAGMTDVVQVVAGDAFKEIPKLQGQVDFVFLDAWKPDYRKFLDLVLPRLAPGGLFLAHNVINKRNEMGDFLKAIQASPELLTTIVSPASEGMSVSWKRGVRK